MIKSLFELSLSIKEDLKVNIFLKSKFILVFFRLANFFATHSLVVMLIGIPIIALYILVVEWALGVEIHVKTKIGKGLVIYHGFGLVVNGYAVIGEHCQLRQGCCIGNKVLPDGSLTGAPVIGDNVDFGVNAVVLGDIEVGSDTRIGANAVVLKDVTPGATVVGVPAKEV